jgi:hypothetical protein
VTEFVAVIKGREQFNQRELSVDVDTLDAVDTSMIWVWAPPIIETFVNVFARGGEFIAKAPLVVNKEHSLIVSCPLAIPLDAVLPIINKSVKEEVPLVDVNTRLVVSIKTELLNDRFVPVLCKVAEVVPLIQLLVVVPAFALVTSNKLRTDVLETAISIVLLPTENVTPKSNKLDDVPAIFTVVVFEVIDVFNIQFDFPEPLLFKEAAAVFVLDCIIELSVLLKEIVPVYTDEFNLNNLFVLSQECARLVKSNPFLLLSIPVSIKG